MAAGLCHVTITVATCGVARWTAPAIYSSESKEATMPDCPRCNATVHVDPEHEWNEGDVCWPCQGDEIAALRRDLEAARDDNNTCRDMFQTTRRRVQERMGLDDPGASWNQIEGRARELVAERDTAVRRAEQAEATAKNAADWRDHLCRYVEQERDAQTHLLHATEKALIQASEERDAARAENTTLRDALGEIREYDTTLGRAKEARDNATRRVEALEALVREVFYMDTVSPDWHDAANALLAEGGGG